MEKLDIYNQFREKTGRTRVRGESLADHDFFMVIHICIINSCNQMLIQKRQDFKPSWPGLWDISVGGCVSEGETSFEAAKREAFEELGYIADKINPRPQFTINFSKGFDDYYIINDDVDLDTLKLQPEEVEAVKWASEKEICGMIEREVFIPYRKSLLRMIFDMQSGRGAVQHS